MSGGSCWAAHGIRATSRYRPAVDDALDRASNSTTTSLDTPDQRAVAALANELIDAMGEDVRAQIVERLLQLGPPAPAPRVSAYADELLLCTAMQSANGDASRPKVHWSLFPGARAGLDNPDTRYRFVPLDADHRYELRGRRNGSTDVSFQLFDGWQGDGAIGEQLGFVPDDALVVDDDGSFTITLDAGPAAGRPCHLQLPPSSAQLTIRDTLGDWSLEPMALEVVVLDGPERTAPQIEQLASRTRDRVLAQADFWPPIVDAFLLFPPSSMGSANPTPGGLANQCSAPGRFDVGDDDAMVIRAGPGTSGYMGIQLGSLQFVSIEPWRLQSSLNPNQAVRDPDGLFTFVVSRRDPGVANWLDPGDHDSGIVFMRWQAMADELPTPHQPTAEVVAFDRLDDAVRDAVRVSAAERSEQLARRAASAVPPQR
jgi:hypothetical protein